MGRIGWRSFVIGGLMLWENMADAFKRIWESKTGIDLKLFRVTACRYWRHS